jgi:threonine/homoserine/homoserine lactone efflux protein
MTLTEWAPLALVCLLGAMSPGPSLALVVRHAATRGAMPGVFCAITHGIGIFIWASATVTGLGAVLVAQPIWYGLIRLTGAVFLLYLGFSALLSRPNEASEVPTTAQPEYVRVGWEGILIALSNPKIAFFFLHCSANLSSLMRRYLSNYASPQRLRSSMLPGTALSPYQYSERRR